MADHRKLVLARADLGLRETPGAADNPVLMQRLASITKLLGVFYFADSVPQKQASSVPLAIAIRAASWSTWVSPLQADRLAPGAVLVF